MTLARFDALPPDNLDRSVRRWLTHLLVASASPMLADERECEAIAALLMADLDPRSRLILDALDRRYDEGELTRLQGQARRVMSGEPVQRVVGWTAFRGLRIGCEADVLIPRPETEELVGWFLEGMAAKAGPEPQRVLDVGTGSGCIALALKAERPEWDVVAVDLSPEALGQARRNADALGLDVTWMEADALDAEALVALGPWDGIVSNPPYIPRSERLEAHVTDHEPNMALFVPDDDPLVFYRALQKAANLTLVPGGCLAAECHANGARDVADCWKIEGAEPEVLCDLQGKERAVRRIQP